MLCPSSNVGVFGWVCVSWGAGNEHVYDGIVKANNRPTAVTRHPLGLTLRPQAPQRASE